MKKSIAIVALFAFGMQLSGTSHAQIILTGAGHTENFNSLIDSGSTGGGSTPLDSEITDSLFWTGTAGPAIATGWWNGAGTSFGSASDGSSAENSNRLVSYGATSGATQSERALGLGWRPDGAANTSIGAHFQNATGEAITQLDISYDGEFWYHGAIGAVGDLTFDYSLDASSIRDTNATWISVSSLDFTPPGQGSGLQFSARDGNDAANRVAGISASITGLSIADADLFFVRWSNSDSHGMAIDNFSIQPVATTIPEPTSLGLSGMALVGMLARRRRSYS